MDPKTKNIALFPLNMFLLPGEYTRLYIFEPRYKQLIRDCESGELETFGIACLNNYNTMNLGSEVELKEVIQEHEGGEMDVLIQARSVFRLYKFNLQREGKMYPEGTVAKLDQIANFAASEALELAFGSYLLRNNKLDVRLSYGQELGVFDAARELGMDEREKLELAALDTPREMDRYMINYLRYLKILEKQERSVQNDIYLN